MTLAPKNLETLCVLQYGARNYGSSSDWPHTCGRKRQARQALQVLGSKGEAFGLDFVPPLDKNLYDAQASQYGPTT